MSLVAMPSGMTPNAPMSGRPLAVIWNLSAIANVQSPTVGRT
jgi:hypothetical protein